MYQRTKGGNHVVRLHGFPNKTRWSVFAFQSNLDQPACRYIRNGHYIQYENPSSPLFRRYLSFRLTFISRKNCSRSISVKGSNRILCFFYQINTYVIEFLLRHFLLSSYQHTSSVAKEIRHPPRRPQPFSCF